MDIRAKQAGVFVKGFAAEGAEVSVGASLYELDSEGKASLPSGDQAKAEDPAKAEDHAKAADAQPPAMTAPAAETAEAPSAGEPIEVNVPVMGESITTGVLAKWLRKEGERVAADEVVASIETDKVTVEVRSPQAGILSKLSAAEAAEVTVGQPLFTLVPGEPEAAEKVTGSSPAQPEKKPSEQSSPAPPSAEKTGSVYKEATESKKAASEARVQAPAAPTTPSAAQPATPGNRSETRVKMTRMRMRISQRLKEAQNTAAMLTTFQEVDMSRLIDLRNAHKEQFEKTHGVKLGFMSAFVKVGTLST